MGYKFDDTPSQFTGVRFNQYKLAGINYQEATNALPGRKKKVIKPSKQNR